MPAVGSVQLVQMGFAEAGVRPVFPCTWVICYRATNVRPRNPSITLASISLEHGLLLLEAKQSKAYATRGDCGDMFRTRAYTIDSCYVGFAVAGRHPWVRSWWQRLVGR
jgi:hypothetical protein